MQKKGNKYKLKKNIKQHTNCTFSVSKKNVGVTCIHIEKRKYQVLLQILVFLVRYILNTLTISALVVTATVKIN